MKNQNGWVKTHRKILESELWEKPATWFKLWTYILMTVNWEKSPRMELGEGYFNMTKALPFLGEDMTASKIKSAITFFKKSEMIATTKTTRGMKIKVLNYAKYQSIECEPTTIQTTSEQQQNNHRTTTITKELKNKEIKKNTNTKKADAISFGGLEVVISEEMPKGKVGLAKVDNRNPNIEKVYDAFENILGIRPVPIKSKTGFDLNRGAAMRLIKKYDVAGVISMVEKIGKEQLCDRYCKRTTNPLELEQHLAWWKIHFGQKQIKQQETDNNNEVLKI